MWNIVNDFPQQIHKNLAPKGVHNRPFKEQVFNYCQLSKKAKDIGHDNKAIRYSKGHSM